MVFVTFLHPDLGIGGAERLIIDAAIALQSRGHKVHIFTSHFDKNHCFKEAQDGTLTVTAVGDWLPRKLFGRLYAFFAYLRMIYVAFYCVFLSNCETDVFVCDQVSACIPVLRYFGKKKVLFYCHFPDMLLTDRKSHWKRIYRAPLDLLEEKTTGIADLIMVNSSFTASIFHQTFKSLQHITPFVLHPSLHFQSFDETASKDCLSNVLPPSSQTIFLSINRYERKKNLPLAVKAFGKLRDSLKKDQWSKICLVVAGGYDNRVTENKEHYIELRKLTEELNLSDNVVYMRSFTDSQKIALLKEATCLLYTPSNEHFGIVPIEAMYMHCPVIACRSGGPLETVKDNSTGYLCDATPEAFSFAMKKFIDNQSLSMELGSKGRRHVINNFSFEAFSDKFESSVCLSAGKQYSNHILAEERSLLVPAFRSLFFVYNLCSTNSNCPCVPVTFSNRDK